MQIGFVNFNTEEKKRVAKMMQLLQESEAIEELGIGRVRDHFSNTLFPYPLITSALSKPFIKNCRPHQTTLRFVPHTRGIATDA